MIREIYFVVCDCGLELQSDDGKTLLFNSHSEAIRSMQSRGWHPGSESIGGDRCRECYEEKLEALELGAKETET